MAVLHVPHLVSFKSRKNRGRIQKNKFLSIKRHIPSDGEPYENSRISTVLRIPSEDKRLLTNPLEICIILCPQVNLFILIPVLHSFLHTHNNFIIFAMGVGFGKSNITRRGQVSPVHASDSV